jgi:putative glutamine amidotransferase
MSARRDTTEATVDSKTESSGESTAAESLEPARGTVLVSCTNPERGKPYVDALQGAGVPAGSIRLVTPDTVTPEEAGPLAAAAAGLLLCGGPDLDPTYYGDSAVHPTYQPAPARDAVELALLAGARDAKTPLLGICRGMQMTNAFLGGTLWQDIPSMVPGSVVHSVPSPLDHLAHPIELVPGAGPLGEVLAGKPEARGDVGEDRRDHGAILVNQRTVPVARADVDEERRDCAPLFVNSRHHQAVRDLAPGLQTVAVAPDGLVEAFAGTDPDWWLWAVQWHPENIVGLAAQRQLFARFREQVEARAQRQRDAAGADRREPEPALS